MPELLPVEVVYAIPGEQRVVKLEVPAGTTLREVIERSGVLARHRQLDLDTTPVGIHGCLRALTEPVSAHDRVEIYRPLIADPKAQRRARAATDRARRKKATQET